MLRPMTDRGFKIRALGEIAIRCDDIGAMLAFYEGVLGLERLSGNATTGQIVFLKIAEGYGGHTSVLALFDKGYDARPDLHPSSAAPPFTGAQSSLHHIALSLGAEEQDAAIEWYRMKGVDFRIEHFDWIGWRGVFTKDPEGNTVELVAYSDQWSTDD